MTDRYTQSDCRSPGRRVVGFMVEWLSSSSSEVPLGRVKSLLVDWKVASSKGVLGYGILDRSVTLP